MINDYYVRRRVACREGEPSGEVEGIGRLSSRRGGG